jgi:hypothetical protein
MGARGPVGKKNDAKMGHRTKAELAGADIVNLDEIDDELIRKARAGQIPGDEKWHPVAKHWYDSLPESGQSIYYQPSDWAIAYLLAESLSRDFKPQFVGVNEESGEPIFETIPLKGASLGAYLKGFTALLATEGDRRRMQIELERESLKGQGKDDVTEDGVVLDRAAMFKQGGRA